MRILLVHNFYRERGGEDQAVETDLSLLKANGHEAELFSVSSNDLLTPIQKMRAVMQITYSQSSRVALAEKLRSFCPDIVHVHNFFPILTPSVYDACSESGIPVVQTLHNYRTTCANGLLLRKNEPCTLCVQGNPYQAVKYGCYRGSRLASIPLARMIQHHRQEHTWQEKTQRILVPTEFSKRLHTTSGINAEHICVRVHSIASDPGFAGPEKRESHGIYVGRLSEEKGIATLVAASKSLHEHEPIAIIGQGEEIRLIKENKKFHARGFISSIEVTAAMKKACFLIFPTLCFEGAFPLVLVEAMANGLPIIASRVGAIPEMLKHEENALLFPPGDSLALKELIKRISSDSELRIRLAINARKVFESTLTPQKSYQQLIDIYNGLKANSIG